MSTKAKDAPDITNSMFYILLSLADGPLHGLGMVADIEARTAGRVKMGPALLYSSIKRMVSHGLVAETKDRPAEDDPRRRYYELTPTGQKALRSHAELWAATVEIARDKKVIG